PRKLRGCCLPTQSPQRAGLRGDLAGFSAKNSLKSFKGSAPSARAIAMNSITSDREGSERNRQLDQGRADG
ncbi:MAG: hypothetical protein WAU79_06380, partial [Bradyrhizobium sp.]|uniref:hypothetical protein n=1 Tax=Bradyrhizobium sp. TaxID=376 RepID=UPI003BB18E5B